MEQVLEVTEWDGKLSTRLTTWFHLDEVASQAESCWRYNVSTKITQLPTRP